MPWAIISALAPPPVCSLWRDGTPGRRHRCPCACHGGRPWHGAEKSIAGCAERQEAGVNESVQHDVWSTVPPVYRVIVTLRQQCADSLSSPDHRAVIVNRLRVFRRAVCGICIKLSVDSLRKYCGFVVVCQTVAQDWRGGASFSRRLDSQTYGGGTGTGEQTAPGELGLQHALHPPRSQRLARPPALQHTPLSGLLHPPCRPHRWTERRIAPHEAPATVERPAGRVGFGGLAGGAMERALPSLAHSALRADSSTFTPYQGPARCALEAYVPRLITSPSS